MTTKVKFEYVNTDCIGLVQDAIGWGVTARASNYIVQAAEKSAAMGDGVLTEDMENTSPYKQGDQVHALLIKAANLFDGAILDGVAEAVLDDEFEKAMSNQWVVQPRRYNFTNQAFDELYKTSDEFVMATPEEQKVLTQQRNLELIAERRGKDISMRDARIEHQDLALVYIDVVTNPTSSHTVTSDGNYDEYLETRSKAFQSRAANLRSGSTILHGEWINRYDFNGAPKALEAGTMDASLAILITEGIRLRIEMPHPPASQEDIAKARLKMQTSV